jgi:hypothetical protein
MVYAMAGFRGNSLKAIKLAEAKGELTGAPAVAFTYDRDTPYVPSPLLYKGGLYFLKSNSGILTQLDAGSGAVRFMQRLEATPNVYASPVAAAGLIYVVGREGTTVVIEAGPVFKPISHQRPRRAHRCVPGAGWQRDLHSRDETPVPHLVLITYANHGDTKITENARRFFKHDPKRDPCPLCVPCGSVVGVREQVLTLSRICR